MQSARGYNRNSSKCWLVECVRACSLPTNDTLCFFIVVSLHPGVDIGYYGSDVKLTQGQLSDMKLRAMKDAGRFIQNAVLRPDLFETWTNGRVPYIFDGSLGKLLAVRPLVHYAF